MQVGRDAQRERPRMRPFALDAARLAPAAISGDRVGVKRP
jgi:hypothetical protein